MATRHRVRGLCPRAPRPASRLRRPGAWPVDGAGAAAVRRSGRSRTAAASTAASTSALRPGERALPRRTGSCRSSGTLPHAGPLPHDVRTADGYSVTLVHLGSIGGDDGDTGRRGRRRRDDRAERRRRGRRAVRPSRHPADRRPERLRRPAGASSTARAAGTTSGLAPPAPAPAPQPAPPRRAASPPRVAPKRASRAASAKHDQAPCPCDAADIRPPLGSAPSAPSRPSEARSRGRRASGVREPTDAAPGSLRLERAARCRRAGSSARAGHGVRRPSRAPGAQRLGTSGSSSARPAKPSRAGAWIEARGADRDRPARGLGFALVPLAIARQAGGVAVHAAPGQASMPLRKMSPIRARPGGSPSRIAPHSAFSSPSPGPTRAARGTSAMSPGSASRRTSSARYHRLQGRRRPDGQRHGRARDAGHGRRRSGGAVSA